MKTKVLLVLLTCFLLGPTAWFVHGPIPAHADKVDPVPQQYRECVAKGLEFLAKNQCEDGHWEGEGGQHPVAMTGLAGLAMLMEGIASNGKYSVRIRKAVDWLIDRSQAKRGGLIFSDHPSETDRYMYGHGLATLFLAGVYRDSAYVLTAEDRKRREKVTDVLTLAVNCIGNAQSTQRGWYRTSRVEGHDLDEIAATVIQIQALQAAQNAGMPIPSDAVNDGLEYLQLALAKYEKGAEPWQSRGRPIETAAALACHLSSLGKNELRKKWFKYCQKSIPVGSDVQLGRDELVHHYYALAVFCSAQGHDFMDPPPQPAVWHNYRTAMFDHLQKCQNQDGSWPASQTSIGVGPIYSTALWCTVLQLDRNCHPLIERIHEITK